MKRFRDIFYPSGMKKELTSHHLKNILFWKCEDFHDDSDWTQDKLAMRVRSMCERLIRSIQRKKLELYFHIGVNLLETKDKEVLNRICQNAFDFLNNPTHFL